MEQAYWNGLPTRAVRGTAVVAPAPEFPQYWATQLVGQRIEVVQVVLDHVNFGGGIGYLDNREGEGWYKVTEGKGSPQIGHRNVLIEPDSFVLSEEDQSFFDKEVAELQYLLENHDNIVASALTGSGNRQTRRLTAKRLKKSKKR